MAARVTAAAVAAVTRLATFAAALMQSVCDVVCLPGCWSVVKTASNTSMALLHASGITSNQC